LISNWLLIGNWFLVKMQCLNLLLMTSSSSTVTHSLNSVWTLSVCSVIPFVLKMTLFKCLKNDNFYSLRLFEFQILSLCSPPTPFLYEIPFCLTLRTKLLIFSFGSSVDVFFYRVYLWWILIASLLIHWVCILIPLLLMVGYCFLPCSRVTGCAMAECCCLCLLGAAHTFCVRERDDRMKQQNDFNDYDPVRVCKWPNFYVWVLVGDVLHGEKCNVYYINNRRSIRESECGNASRLSMKPTMSMSLFFWDGICMLFACTVIVWQLAIICYPISVFF